MLIYKQRSVPLSILQKILEQLPALFEKYRVAPHNDPLIEIADLHLVRVTTWHVRFTFDADTGKYEYMQGYSEYKDEYR